jgi:plastocyanin
MKNPFYRPAPVLLLLILVGAILIAGCSSSSPPAPVVTTSPPTSMPTATAVITTIPVTVPSTVPTTLESTTTPDETKLAVAIKNLEFAPKDIMVKAGTTVTWTNMDGLPHTVTSKTPSPISFDSKRMEKGDTFSFTFTKTGKYYYFCTLHTFMTGTITVIP